MTHAGFEQGATEARLRQGNLLRTGGCEWCRRCRVCNRQRECQPSYVAFSQDTALAHVNDNETPSEPEYRRYRSKKRFLFWVGTLFGHNSEMALTASEAQPKVNAENKQDSGEPGRI